MKKNATPRTFMLWFLLGGRPGATVARAAAMITVIAVCDWRIESNIPLGFLYLFPMLLLGSVLNRWQIALAAALCTFLTEIFDSFEWFSPAGIPRDILMVAAFFGMGLFVYETVRNRRLEQLHVARIEQEVRARGEAEEQLKILVESSPAAVFTTTAAGEVLLANEAAHRLFGVPSAGAEGGGLEGRSILGFLPSLANVPPASDSKPPFRTVMQCRGRRQNGELFLADVWFSTYKTSAGSRLAAMVVDGSEDLRNREELSLHQLLAGSRILVGAVSHEVRNVCGALAMAHANLARSGGLEGNKDFEALRNLIMALEKIASMDLRQMADQAASVDLPSLLEELRIVVEPSLADREIRFSLEVGEGVSAVWADRQSLLQVFLNLTRNAERAMLEKSGLDPAARELAITARREKHAIQVRFRDTGGGVLHPERLFRPFQQQAEATGLGLYLSRAFMRSFRGDLHYRPEPGGSGFIVELIPVMPHDANGNSESSTAQSSKAHPDPPRGRSQPVSGQPEPVT